MEPIASAEWAPTSALPEPTTASLTAPKSTRPYVPPFVSLVSQRQNCAGESSRRTAAAVA
jgi:hypothetical protein